MPKILVFTDAFSGGGAEEVLKIFSHELSRNHDVIHVAKWQGPKQIELSKNKVSLGRTSTLGCFLPVLRLIKDFQPDIILTSTVHNNLIFLIMKSLRLIRCKVIIRESSIPHFLNRASLKTLIIDKLLVSILYKKAHRIIVQSGDMKESLIIHYGLPEAKLIKIFNPIVDLEGLNETIENTPRIFGYEKNTKIVNICAVGRLSKEKGFSRLLRVMANLPSYFHLSIAGDGALKKDLEAEAILLGLESRVRFVGFLSSDRLREFILTSDLFVQSSYVEGFPNTLVQSIYLGVPAIAFNCPGGTKEIIDSENGVLVHEESALSMAEAILNASKREFNSKNMRKRLLQKFSTEKSFTLLEEIISDATNL